MYDFEDFSEEISRRKGKLLDGILSRCVTADTLVNDGLSKFYMELRELREPCLGRDWKALAGKLLKPPPTSATIENLSKSANPARKLLKTWVSQSNGLQTFHSLIETMVECKLYSACDELLDFFENYENDSGCDAESSNTRVERRRRSRFYLIRSVSCPAGGGWFSRFRGRIKTLFRSDSAPAGVSIRSPPSTPIPLPPREDEILEDEIFIVSSNSDHQTQAMFDLMSFVYKIQLVTTGMLTVRTIHDLDQNGQVTTTWLEERVNRAKYVILCFSSIMKAIVEQSSDMPLFEHQMDYNLKFTMDFLVKGTIIWNICRNPKGKFIPVLLPGHDMSTLIVPLRYFLHFSWPSDEEKISKYIMNVPEHPVPRQGTPKRLVRKEFC